jgi:TIR domain
MAYQYDVFVSYRRQNPVRGWVQEQFHPLLTQWLAESMPEEPSIFIDEGIETGETWPDTLRHALKTSRLLVPVLSPPYFRSRWCRAELDTMLAREQELGMRTPHNRDGLILPIRFHDGEHFPAHMRQMQPEDFTPWAFGAPYFADSAHNIGFVEAVKQLAVRLAARLPHVPAWDPAWPVRLPEPTPVPHSTPLPRLR